MIRHILYFSGIQIYAHLWRSKKLLSSTSFNTDQDGFELFSTYIDAHKNQEIRILVDMYEEDFRKETLPNVIGSDRKAIIERLISKHYRDEKYTYSHKLSRNKSGRKDAQVLLCALSESHVFEQFINTLEKYQCIISGIWSLPVIGKSLLKQLQIKAEYTLVLSQQTPNHQREIFFNNFDLCFSRKTPIDWTSDGSHVFYEKVEQIHKFITNQRMMGLQDQLDVVCIYSDKNAHTLKNTEHNIGSLNYHFFPIDNLLKKLGIKSEISDHGNIIYSYICSTLPARTNHYATNTQRDRYFTNSYKKIIQGSCSIASAVMIAISAIAITNHYQITKEIENKEMEFSDLYNFYQENYANYESELATVDDLAFTSDSANQLLSLSKRTPFSLFPDISQVYSQQQFSPLMLTGISWSVDVGLNRESKMAIFSKDGEYIEEESDGESSLYTMSLSGSLKTQNTLYRDNVALINEWKKQIQTIDSVKKIALIKIPNDIRQKSEFSDNLNKNSEINPNNFQYELLMEIVYDHHKTP